MTGRERKLAAINARRLKSTIRRVEQQPYDTRTPVRQPRLGAGSGHFLCQLTGTLAAATGTWPSLTPGQLTNQQIYGPSYDGSAYSLQAVGTATATVLNYSANAFAAGKTTDVIGTAGGAYRVVVQDC